MLMLLLSSQLLKSQATTVLFIDLLTAKMIGSVKKCGVISKLMNLRVILVN